MQIHLETGGVANLIRLYESGRIMVREDSYRSSLIVLPDRLITDWPPQRFADLTAEHIRTLATLNCEVLLLGTGRQLRFPPPVVLAPLAAAGVGLEVMDTGAACRTYNILMAEGRQVAAALLMIE